MRIKIRIRQISWIHRIRRIHQIRVLKVALYLLIEIKYLFRFKTCYHAHDTNAFMERKKRG